MKKIISIFMAATVVCGSLVIPDTASAAVSNGTSCHLKVTSEEAELIGTPDPSAVSGSSIGTNDKYRYSITVKLKNNGSNTINKASVTGTVGDIKLTFRTGKLKSKKTITLDKEFESTDPELNGEIFDKEQVRTVYSSETDVYDYASSDDHKIPIISGFTGKGSYEVVEGETIPFMTVYSKQKNSFKFKKYVKAKDNSGDKVSITVNTDNVNFNKKGIYTIHYTATDDSGNSRTVPAKIAVRKESDTIDRYAKQALGRIIKSSWSDKSKAQAICKYVNRHVKYNGHHRSRNWEKEAINGLRYGTGDCITYYSTTRALLTRAGIPNTKVKLYRISYRRHAWNMAYVNGGFYHIDSCPRRRAKIFCLVTDEQLRHYATRVERNSHVWDPKTTPKTPSKKIGYIR